MNVSKIVPQTVEQEILSICELNGAYHPCRKRVNTTQMNTIWVEKELIEPVKICCIGYEKVDEVCIPICSTACKNAVCVSPDKCKCNDGFIRDKKEYGFKYEMRKKNNFNGFATIALDNNNYYNFIAIELKNLLH